MFPMIGLLGYNKYNPVAQSIAGEYGITNPDTINDLYWDVWRNNSTWGLFDGSRYSTDGFANVFRNTLEKSQGTNQQQGSHARPSFGLFGNSEAFGGGDSQAEDQTLFQKAMTQR